MRSCRYWGRLVALELGFPTDTSALNGVLGGFAGRAFERLHPQIGVLLIDTNILQTL